MFVKTFSLNHLDTSLHFLVQKKSDVSNNSFDGEYPNLLLKENSRHTFFNSEQNAIISLLCDIRAIFSTLSANIVR